MTQLKMGPDKKGFIRARFIIVNPVSQFYYASLFFLKNAFTATPISPAESSIITISPKAGYNSHWKNSALQE
jgi:hypothetical protein